MKTKFSKLTLMTRESQRKLLTESMQELGLLHIVQETYDVPEETKSLIHELNIVNRLIRLLENEEDGEEIQQAAQPVPVKEAMTRLQKKEEQIEKINQEIERLEKEAHYLAPWGDYAYEKFHPLIEQGVYIYLCHTDKKSFKKLDRSQAIIQQVNQYGRDSYFVVITDQKDYNAPYEHFPLPKTPPSILQDKIHQLQNKQSQVRASLQEEVVYLPMLKQYKTSINDAIALAEIQASFSDHSEEKVISLSAWFPVHKKLEVVKFLEKENVVWKIRDPQKGENVPVVLKNRKYPRLFEPITRVFDLPNYYETDLTPILAVFYPILFAYCLGDAGYGFVLAVLMLAGYFSFLKTSRNVAWLGMILGAFTMLMGFIKSGSLFGIALLPDHPAAWVRQLSQWVIIKDDSSLIFNAFNVALMIGVIQILTGVIIAIYNKIRYEGYAYAISPFGKLLIVTSLIWIFLADMQGVGSLDVLGDFRKYLLITGITLVIFFHDIDLTLVKRVGGSFMPLFFIFTGILGDILSYVRLFALGLASSVLGLVVNQIGQQIMEGSIINVVIGILFLVFGHTLNFGIAALGSFVHPLRLTFVEFYGNVGFQGKGLIYRPFRKSKQTL